MPYTKMVYLIMAMKNIISFLDKREAKKNHLPGAEPWPLFFHPSLILATSLLREGELDFENERAWDLFQRVSFGGRKGQLEL